MKKSSVPMIVRMIEEIKKSFSNEFQGLVNGIRGIKAQFEVFSPDKKRGFMGPNNGGGKTINPGELFKLLDDDPGQEAPTWLI